MSEFDKIYDTLYTAYIRTTDRDMERKLDAALDILANYELFQAIATRR